MRETRLSFGMASRMQARRQAISSAERELVTGATRLLRKTARRSADIAALDARLDIGLDEAAEQYDQEPNNIRTALAILPTGEGPLPAASERVTWIARKIQNSESNRRYWAARDDQS